MKIYGSVLELIGSTPLIRLERYAAHRNLPVELLAKVEGQNPGGSVKDRVALEIITQAETRGILRPGSVIIEPTSGNTGIGLALVGTLRGYRVILTMPDSMSRERREALAVFGAEVVLTPGGMPQAIAKAEELAAQIPGSFLAGQFENPANPLAHARTTGPEIWTDTQGRVDVFVAGAGTGGTLTGVGRYLKSRNPRVYVAAVEPTDSPVLSAGRSGPHRIQGIGPGFVPENLDREILDEILPVEEEAAFAACRALAREEGLLAGISSGAVLSAGEDLARRAENRGKRMVLLFPDTGLRYLSLLSGIGNNP